MKSYQKPLNYVEVQRAANSRHTDGSLENQSDSENAAVAFNRLPETDLPIRTILILGCRTGYEGEVANETFTDPLVVGVDIVPEFVKESCKRVPTLLGNMHDLDLPDWFFDLIVCRGTLEHCYNPMLALEEMYRVSRELVYLTVDLEPDRDKFKSHFAFSEDPEEWKEMFKDCGFAILEEGFDEGMCHKGLWVILKKAAESAGEGG